MLDMVRELIDQKRTFLEDAELLYEDTMGSPEDILTEDFDMDEESTENGTEPESINESDPMANDTPGAVTGAVEPPGTSPANPVAGAVGTENDDLMSASTNKEIDDKKDDSPEDSTEPALPMKTSVSDIEDGLMDVTINITTNTVSDVLPVAPANAGDAIKESTEISEDIVDDLMATTIEESWETPEDDSGDDLMETPMSESPDIQDQVQDTDDIMNTPMGSTIPETITEAINMADGKGDSAGGSDTGDAAGGESDVTKAVMDKVDEAEPEMDGDGDMGGGNSSGSVSRDSVFDHLDKLQRNILDTKEKIKRELG